MKMKFYDYGHVFKYQGDRQSRFITDIMKGEYGDFFEETLTEWDNGGDTFGFKAKVVSGLKSNGNMKQEIIEKTVQVDVFFEEQYEKDKERNAQQFRSLTYRLKQIFDVILQLLEVGVEDTLKVWNTLKEYSRNTEWDTKQAIKAIKEDENMQRAIVEKVSDSFMHSPYYEQKLKAWVGTEGDKKKRNVKQKIVNELKNEK